MTLLERLQILLPHTPPVPWPTVDLPGTVHRQARRFILEDEPFHPIDVRLVPPEVLRVALEDRLHIGLVVFQEEGARADGGLRFLQVAELLHHFRGDDPHAPRIRQSVDQPDERLFEDELHGIAIDHLDALHAVQHIAVRVPRISQKAVIGEFDILSHQLAAVNGRFIVPFHTLAQMEDIGCIVQLLPSVRRGRARP